MINIPNNYSEWIECLDILKESTMDDQVIDAMRRGNLSWQSGVAERFTNELFKVIQMRIQLINDMLKKLLENNCGTEFGIANALVNGRKSICTLLELSNIEAFPESLKKMIKKILKNYADSIQNSLIDSAELDRTGKLKIIVKSNPINRFDNIKSNLTINNKIGLCNSTVRRIIIN